MTSWLQGHGIDRAHSWFIGLALTLLAACGGGGDSPDAAPPLPAAVTATVPADGGNVDVKLADGASATLAFPAQAFLVDRPVTVTPEAAAQGEWTRFTIRPGIGQLRAPLVLRVRPPAGVDAAQVPVLQIITAEGPLLLQTRRLPDGLLEATAPPQLATPSTAAAAPGRARSLSAARALADGDAEATTIAGTGFLAVCEVPQPTIANARAVILNASSISQVRTAISTLAMMEDRCSTGEALGALDGLAAQLPALYTEALAAWRAVNYLEVETQFQTFRRGVHRVMALCAAAGELGSALDCPLTPDYDSEYTEIANGFAAAANERDTTAGLRLMFEALSTLPGEAALFGLPQAEPALRQTVALIADRLMDRDYTLCNHGALFEWRQWVEGGGFSNRSAAAVRRAMAYCGTAGAAAHIVSADDGSEQRLGERSFAAGAIDGGGRIQQQSITVPRDAKVLIAIGGPTTRCSRVIGAPEVFSESLSLRVGSTEVGLISLRSPRDPEGPALREARFDMPLLLRDLGRASDSTAPVVIDVWRPAVTGLQCTDASGGTTTVAAEEEKLYTLELSFPREPSGWRGTIDVNESWFMRSANEFIRGSDGATVRVEERRRVEGRATLTVDTPRLPFGQTTEMDILSVEGSGTYFIQVVIETVDTRPEARCPYRSVRVSELSFAWAGTPFADRVTLLLDADGRYGLAAPSLVFNPVGETRFGNYTFVYSNLGGTDCPPSSSNGGMDPELFGSAFSVNRPLPLVATGTAADNRIAGRMVSVHADFAWSLQAR